MEVNVCKNCENYRADGSCNRTCESWHKAFERVTNYCTGREECDGCPLRWIGCSNVREYRNQALVQVAEALQTQDGQEWLSSMKSKNDFCHAMGMMTDSEVYNKHLAEEEKKDARILEVAKLLQEFDSDVCREAAQYLTEYKDMRWEERNLD